MVDSTTRAARIVAALIIVGTGVASAGCSVEGGFVVTAATPSVASPSGAASVAPDDGDAAAASLAALSTTRLFFGHQSVGENVLDGLSKAFAAAGLREPRVVESRAAPSDDQPAIISAYIGSNGDPIGKMTDFSNLVNHGIGDHVQVALMKLCYVDLHQASDPEDVFRHYRDTMSALEKAHPGVVFLYTTDPLTTEDDAAPVAATSLTPLSPGARASSDNMVREQYNTLVRAAFGATGRLLDIAALESTRTDGTVMAADADGQVYRVMDPDLTSDGGHLNDAGSRKVAIALAELVAKTNG